MYSTNYKYEYASVLQSMSMYTEIFHYDRDLGWAFLFVDLPVSDTRRIVTVSLAITIL